MDKGHLLCPILGCLEENIHFKLKFKLLRYAVLNSSVNQVGRMRLTLLIINLIFWSLNAQAHKMSDGFLALQVEGKHIAGQWDIALHDLDHAIKLDLDNDKNITPAELDKRRNAVYVYAITRLLIASDQQPCPIQPSDLSINARSDGDYAALKLAADCPNEPKALTVGYQLFFDLDPLHRGNLRLKHGERIDTAIFSPANSRIEFTPAQPTSHWIALRNFMNEGIWHIWIGYDHVLFLLSLLLPAAMVREGKNWRATVSFSTAFWEVFKIVAAFTIAHSITLSLAVLGYVSLPSRWIESVIAASVAIAALNNIYPIFLKRRILLAFGFGLVHGLGIASVLLDMALPLSQRLLSLVGFNLGVEVGQVAIVGVALPLITYFSRYPFYTPLVLESGSACIACIALYWLVERSLDLQINLI